MSVIVLCAADAVEAVPTAMASASARFGSITALAGSFEEGGDGIDGDVRVLLAATGGDTAWDSTLFASAAAASRRKILHVAAPAAPLTTPDARAEALALIALSDMLIFTRRDFAAFFGGGLGAEHEGFTKAEDFLAARSLLTRPNQAAVVMLDEQGAMAIWADRILTSPACAAQGRSNGSAKGDGLGDHAAAACFCGVVAACVDQGIGPEAALRYANAAIALLADASSAIPDRGAIEAMVQGLPSA